MLFFEFPLNFGPEKWYHIPRLKSLKIDNLFTLSKNRHGASKRVLYIIHCEISNNSYNKREQCVILYQFPCFLLRYAVMCRYIHAQYVICNSVVNPFTPRHPVTGCDF